MKIRYVAFAGALALSSSAVMAGLSSPQPVTVTVNADGSGAAGGAMGTARKSLDSKQYIGCGIRYSINSSGSGTFKSGFCQASTSTGVVGFCNLDASDVTNALQSMADYSFVSFSWNAAGVCTRIGVSTQSMYIP